MKLHFRLASLGVLAWATALTPAFAASEAAEQGNAAVSNDYSAGGDIIVTARRRNETSLQAPVVLSAFSGEQLARLNVQSVIDIGKLTDFDCGRSVSLPPIAVKMRIWLGPNECDT